MTEDRTAFESISSATILKPGDKVLVTLRDWPNPDDIAEYRKRLTERFPGVEFTVASGIDQVAVVPGVWQERIEEMWWAHYHREEAKLDD
jgi:hypothetical protein